MKGVFITFEGNEGSGKSTQLFQLATELQLMGYRVRSLREPGGTPIGEEVRHTLKHSNANVAMTPETELLLMNACRAQLVREVIQPAIAAGEIVLCDRFYDSTIAYQGYGRRLDLKFVRSVIDFAVGDTRPDLTLLMVVPYEQSQQRIAARQSTMPFIRDRIEDEDRGFFERVAQGYHDIAKAEPLRVREIDASGSLQQIEGAVWRAVSPILPPQPPGMERLAARVERATQ